jgi:phosphoribosylformylglycinamidine synthase
VFKVETHNHPTAISPFPGAATGAGGEIRDEGATGRGAKPKAGLCGFSVSHLRLPQARRGWENDSDVASAQASDADYGYPSRIADALSIMVEGPIGAAAFNNEFGRPNLIGYFRSFEANVGGRRFGYHKPIMIAGGIGSIRDDQTRKLDLPPGTLMIQLGGPGMRIGLGGGAASSMGAGTNTEQLDFDSVQRGNAEIQRRAQEVIDRCWELGGGNPILSIHDVGAGGLSNAMPELADTAGRGARFDLGKIPVEESGMSPLEIWCNESQERYALAIAPASLPAFDWLCQRERCPYAVVGSISDDGDLVVGAPGQPPAVQMPMSVLLGKPPKMHREVTHVERALPAIDTTTIDLATAALDVLRHPTVASKNFLITIGDRSVGGLNCRDSLVGPWQVPVADCAVTLLDYVGYAGEAMAMGERTPLAIIDAAASARMAIGEALTNLAAADIELSRVKLSANWMAACGQPGEDARLFDAVAAASALCQQLGISIPVGKDSLSMKTAWQQAGEPRQVAAPVSLIVSAAAPVDDVRRSLTPQLDPSVETVVILIDLGEGRQRLGGSMLAQVSRQFGNDAPDLEDPARLAAALRVVRSLATAGKLLAYHDRSDGGLFAALCEMAFAGHCGVTVNIDVLAMDPVAADWGDFKIRPEQVSVRRNEQMLRALFNEELGILVQARKVDQGAVMDALRAEGLGPIAHVVAKPNERDVIEVWCDARSVFARQRTELQQAWSEVSWQIARMRDNPACADQEFERIADAQDTGLSMHLSFDPAQDVAAPMIGTGARPRIAILREQGVNSQYEMASAFDRAGFTAVDVHMTDLIAGRVQLGRLQGLRRLRRVFLRRRARRRRRLGQEHPAQPGLGRTVRRLLRARRQLCLGRVQRLPDDEPAGADHSGRAGLAPLRTQPVRAVRGSAGDGRGDRVAVAVLRRHGRQPDADRQRARRRAGGLCKRGRASAGHRIASGMCPLRGCAGQGDRALSVQSQRLAGRHQRADHSRRPLHDHHAAPGAGAAHGADELAAAGPGRRLPVDALVPQRTALAGLIERVRLQPATAVATCAECASDPHHR